MGMFKLLSSFQFNFGGLFKSRKKFISLIFDLHGVYVCKTLPFNGTFFDIYCNVFLFISDSFHLNPLFVLVSWANYQFCLSSQKAAEILILCIVFFVSILFISALSSIISYYCLFGGLSCSCFSKYDYSRWTIEEIDEARYD